MEQQYKIWDSLSEKDRESLVEYYKHVLLTGMLKVRTSDILRKHKKLLKWCVKKDLTIWDIPKRVFKNMQILLIGRTMETPL